MAFLLRKHSQHEKPACDLVRANRGLTTVKLWKYCMPVPTENYFNVETDLSKPLGRSFMLLQLK